MSFGFDIGDFITVVEFLSESRSSLRIITMLQHNFKIYRTWPATTYTHARGQSPNRRSRRQADSRADTSHSQPLSARSIDSHQNPDVILDKTSMILDLVHNLPDSITNIQLEIARKGEQQIRRDT